ncbi:MAG TPA: cytidine deaminase [Verrucomicrobiae bacterium]
MADTEKSPRKATAPSRRRTRGPGRGRRGTISDRRAVRLVRAAAAARVHAVAPYSRFQVGAALLTADGEVVTGANVESASYGLTCCAERVALFKALTRGHSRFVGLAVVARLPGGPMPCGACRQLLAEYAPAAIVWVADSQAPDRIRRFTVRDLLPQAFLKAPPNRR